MITTVTGPIAAPQLCYCQCHEHLALSRGESFQKNPALLLDDPEKSLREVLDYKAAGGHGLVDAQPLGCNRMAPVLARLGEKSGLAIMGSTGFHKTCFYPRDHWIFTEPQEAIAALYRSELETGMFADGDTPPPQARTNARAHVIKAALEGKAPDPTHEKLFGAAARVAAQTGHPLMVHIEQGSDPEALLGWLLDRGVPPGKILFCHMDRACPDLAVHKRVLARGIYLEMDTIGRFRYHSDRREAEILRELLEAGYEKQLLLSLDTTGQRMKAYNAEGVGLAYLLRTFLPFLRQTGVPEETIQTLTVQNPRDALDVTKEYSP